MAVYLIDYENVNTDGLKGISRLSAEDTVIIFYSENADRLTFGLHRRLNESKAAIDIRKVDVGGSNALDFQLGTYLGYLIALDREQQYCIVSNDRGYNHVANFWGKQKIKVRVVSEISLGRPEAPKAEQSRPEPARTEPAQPAPVPETAVPAEKPEQTAAPAGEPAPEAQPAPEGAAPAEKPEQERPNRNRRRPAAKAAKPAAPEKPVPPALTEILPVPEEAALVEGFIEKYKTKQGLNNALVRKFGNTRGGELYQKLKPLIADKKGC